MVPSRPVLEITFSHADAVGLAWLPTDPEKYDTYQIVRMVGVAVPNVSPWLVVLTTLLLSLLLLSMVRKPEVRYAFLVCLLVVGTLVSQLAAKHDARVRVLESSGNPYTTTFIDTGVRDLAISPGTPYVSYVLFACDSGNSCVASEPVVARVDSEPAGGHGVTISKFTDESLWTVVDDAAVLVSLGPSTDSGGQRNGMKVEINFSALEPMAAIRFDQPIDLSQGNTITLDLESLDQYLDDSESVRVELRLVNYEELEQGFERTSFVATVPGWLRGRKLLRLPKREFLRDYVKFVKCEPNQDDCTDTDVTWEQSRRDVATDLAWSAITWTAIRFIPVDDGVGHAVFNFREISSVFDPRVENQIRRLMIHYHGWYSPESWGADAPDMSVMRDYPRNIGAAFYPWVLNDPEIGHYVNAEGSTAVSREAKIALLQRHVDWIAQTGAGTVIYSWVGKGLDSGLPPSPGLQDAIGPFEDCPPVEPELPVQIQGSGPSPTHDTLILELMSRLHLKGISTAFLVDATVDRPFKSPCHVVREQKAVLHTYGHHDGFFYDISREGMPLFVTFATQRAKLPGVDPIPACLFPDPNRESWCSQLASMTGRFGANVTAQAVNEIYVRDGGFGGVNHYDPFFVGPKEDVEDDSPYHIADVDFGVSRNLRAPKPLIWIPTYSAGFDKTRAIGHDLTRIERISRHWDPDLAPPWDPAIPRDENYTRPCADEFEYFDDFFALTLKHDPDYIGITEFNEWYEGTNIEPATFPLFSTAPPYPAGGCTYEDAEALTPPDDIYDFF